jgi:tetratricopeptide (TPR) repeat protein
MEVDPMMAQVCTLRAHLAGYSSSEINISGFNSYSNPKLPPMVLTPSNGDPTLISAPDNVVPGKAQSAWKAGLQAVNVGNMAEATAKFQAAVTAVPKFAPGWNALGLVHGAQQKIPESREAFERAIAADPKLLAPYVNLARLCIRTQDWDAAAKTADAYLKADPKHQFPEMYLHQAVARYWLQDLAGAETSAQLAARSDQTRKGFRAEYVIGRILLAKGDASGARQHIAKYLELDPNTGDVEQIKAELQNLDQPDPKAIEPDLEQP